jgi:hypothetical protein
MIIGQRRDPQQEPPRTSVMDQGSRHQRNRPLNQAAARSPPPPARPVLNNVAAGDNFYVGAARVACNKAIKLVIAQTLQWCRAMIVVAGMARIFKVVPKLPHRIGRSHPQSVVEVVSGS